jgi:hypothetical protein
MTEFQALGWAMLIMGTASLVQAVRFRAGVGLFGMTRRHLERTAPPWMRNAVFAGIPLGLGFMLIGIGMTAGEADLGWLFAWLGVSLIPLLIGVLIWALPPDWSKPRWWREADAAGWKGPVPQARRSDTVITAFFAVVFCAPVVIVVTHVKFAELIGPVTMGVGIGLALLAARLRGR